MKKLINCTLLLTAGVIATSSLSFAQGSPLQRQQPPRGAMMQKRQPAHNYLPEFRVVADALAKEYEVKIVVDPALWVPAKPRALQAQTVIAALDELAAQGRKASWKKVYLKGVQGVTIPPEKLAESLRGLDAVEQTGIVVESPTIRRASTLIKNYEVPNNFDKELEAQQFDPGGIYVIYSTVPGGAAGKTLSDRVSDMQRESMELMMQMDEPQLQDAVQRGLDMFMNMDPSMRAKFMGMQMKAGMQAFMNMPQDQRNQLMQEMMGFAQGMFGGQTAPGGRKP
jgi:hypothetical protein